MRLASFWGLRQSWALRVSDVRVVLPPCLCVPGLHAAFFFLRVLCVYIFPSFKTLLIG